jgi:hypothetical protein
MLTTLLTFTMTGILSHLSAVHGKSSHNKRLALEVNLLFLGAIVGGVLLLNVNLSASIFLGHLACFRWRPTPFVIIVSMTFKTEKYKDIGNYKAQ